MRLVLDTNVLVAAHISNGVCAGLYERVLNSETLITSAPILLEFEEKLLSKAKLPAWEAAEVRQKVAESAIVCEAAELSASVCRDPDDDMILGTARAGKADLIVTGDNDLLVLGSFDQIPIVNPAECIERLKRSRD